MNNLAWACADCNSYKGTDLTGIDPETGRIERLFNPRSDVWSEHFAWEGGVMRPKTAIGRVTVTLLKINLPARVDVRRELMAAGLFPSDA